MTQYDAWLKQEKDKIHKNFEQKRQEVLEKSLSDGFDNSSRKSPKGQLSADYERLGREEQAALGELMKQVGEQ